MVTIEIKKFKDMDLSSGTIIEGSPGVGLVSTIAATYLIDYLKLDQICAFDSEDFPPTSMIYASKPKFPARIYASSKHKLGIFLTEFTPPPLIHRPIAKTLLSWCKEQKVRRVISTEGLPSPSKCAPSEYQDDGNPQVFGVGSNNTARKEITKAKIPSLKTGMIYGVSGVLLNEGRWGNYPIITLLAEACPELPDALAAARILEALDKLIPEIQIDTKPLYEESKKIEEYLKNLRKQAEIPPTEPQPYKDMYR
ncbi:MAG: PAC2 family protein [Candidatus Thermoplasmatota archaeon]|nr:PAC2 family protein [Candidatus Thermoplasmatota archaeon]MBU1940986.1 PAC2 family protein [Candidatus Thermoplasmatota archaeon]